MCNSSISLLAFFLSKYIDLFPFKYNPESHSSSQCDIYSYTVSMWTMCGVYEILVTSQQSTPYRLSIIMCVYGNRTMEVNYFVFIPGIRFILTGTWNVHCICALQLFIILLVRQRHTVLIHIVWYEHRVIFIKMLFIFVVCCLLLCATYFYFPCNLIQAILNNSMKFKFRMGFREIYRLFCVLLVCMKFPFIKFRRLTSSVVFLSTAIKINWIDVCIFCRAFFITK